MISRVYVNLFFCLQSTPKEKVENCCLRPTKYVKSLTNIDKKNKDKDFRKRLSIVDFIHFKNQNRIKKIIFI